MNIEKVKEALELAIKLNKSAWSHHNQLFYEAIAELEKPAEENARIIAIDISLGALDRAEYWEVIVPQVIQQYAESYHAKKCAGCVDRAALRFPESRSGVTTDVDK